MAILAEKALMRILSSRLRMGRNREERELKERRKREEIEKKERRKRDEREKKE